MLEALGPYFEPQHVVHAGCRDDDAHLDETRGRLSAVISASQWMADPRSSLAAIVALTARDGLDGFWAHVDVDVLDPAHMPAVDSPDPGGISPSLLRDAMAALWPRSAGLTVGILDPDLDLGGQYAAQVASIVLDAVAESGRAARPQR